MQLWNLQPRVQQQVNTTLRELKGLKGPTVAFHVRGGDLLADLINNVSPSQDNQSRRLNDSGNSLLPVPKIVY